MSPKLFLTRSELARRANLPESALRRILAERDIHPDASAADGRLKLFSPRILELLAKQTRPLC